MNEVDPKFEESRESEQSPGDHGAPVRIDVEETELVDPARENRRPADTEPAPEAEKEVVVDDSTDPVSPNNS